jgi:hypothetical protein
VLAWFDPALASSFPRPPVVLDAAPTASEPLAPAAPPDVAPTVAPPLADLGEIPLAPPEAPAALCEPPSSHPATASAAMSTIKRSNRRRSLTARLGAITRTAVPKHAFTGAAAQFQTNATTRALRSRVTHCDTD